MAAAGANQPGATAQAIGRYRLIRACPTGPGLPEAHLAVDPQDQSQVVLHVLPVPRGQSVGATLLRLKRDVETSLRASHPGLVRAVTLGVDEQRGPFLVREFVEGLSLRAMPSMAVDLDAALRLLVQLAHALEAADAVGVSPRALRLEQIFVTPAGQVRLQVFGLDHAEPPSEVASAFQLARAGLELIVGAEALGEPTGSDVAPRLPDALDKGLARAFARALSADPAERFPTPRAFMQVLIAEAPLDEDRQHLLLELTDQAEPILADRVVADWLRPLRSETSPPAEVAPVASAAGPSPATPAPTSAPTPRGESPAPIAASEAPAPAPPAQPASPRQGAPARPRGRVRLIAVAALVTGLAAAAVALVGGKPPRIVHVATTPPGALLEVGGQAVGPTPIDLADPAPGAVARLTLAGFQPAERPLPSDRGALVVTLEPLPPPPPAAAEQAAPAAGEAPSPPAAASEAPDAAAAPPAPSTPPQARADRPGAPATPPAKPAARPKPAKQFDVYKHLEKQNHGP